MTSILQNFDVTFNDKANKGASEDDNSANDHTVKHISSLYPRVLVSYRHGDSSRISALIPLSFIAITLHEFLALFAKRVSDRIPGAMI